MNEAHGRSWFGSGQRELTALTLAIAVLMCLAGFLVTIAISQQGSASAENQLAVDFMAESERANSDLMLLIDNEVEQFGQSLLHMEATYPTSDAQFARYFDGLESLDSGNFSPYVFIELVDQAGLLEVREREAEVSPDKVLDSMELPDGRVLVVTHRSSGGLQSDEESTRLLVGLAEVFAEVIPPISFAEISAAAIDDDSGESTPPAMLVGVAQGSQGEVLGYLVTATPLESAFRSFQAADLGPLNVTLRNASGGRDVVSHLSGSPVAFEDAEYHSSNSFVTAGTSWEIISWAPGRSPRRIPVTLESFWGIFGTLSLALAWLMWSSRDRRTVDASRRVLLAQELASTDRLTGLLNRGGLFEECRNLGNVSATLFFIDLNHFKAVNDTYGHEMGDRVLLAVAETLKETTRSVDKVARIGGDEFVIVMPGMTDRRRSVRLARAIERSIAGMKSSVTASVGVACSDSPEWLDLALLIQRADSEMYERKQVYHTNPAGRPPLDRSAEAPTQAAPGNDGNSTLDLVEQSGSDG